MRESPRDLGVDPRRSALDEYKSRTVGKSGSLLDLWRYEIWNMLLADANGALGFMLRRLLHPLVLKSRSRGLVLGPRVVMRGIGRITLGDYARIDEGCLLDSYPSSKGITIGDYALLERNVTLSTGALGGGFIRLGERVSVGSGAVLVGHAGIEIGNDVMIGPLSYLTAGVHVSERFDVPIRAQGHAGVGISIEDDVWIGAGAIVLDGVKIRRGAILGAGAVVTREVPGKTIVTGVPARILRRRDEPRRDF